MKNFIQPGNVVSIPAPAAVESGDIVVAGSLVGIASNTAALGANVDVALTGVYEVAKVAADVVTVGAPIYVDANGLATVTATANDRLGAAVEAAGNGVATVKVRLIQL